MKYRPLGEVARIERRSVEPNTLADETPYLGLEDIAPGGHIINYSTVGVAQPKSNKFAFERQHVLFGKLRPKLAKVTRVDRAGVCSTDILPIRPGPDLDGGYLTHFLLQPSVVTHCAEQAAGANLPRLSPSALETIVIPIPSLEEQRRVAGVLDAILAQKFRHDGLRTLLDELTRELFIESFGDPASSASWPSVGFDDVFEDITKHATKVKTSAYLAAGLFPIVDQGQQSVAGYTNDPSLVFHPDEPLILFGDHTRTVRLIEQPFVLGADGVKVLKVASGFDPTFIEWHLRVAPVESLGYSRHMKLLKRQSYLSPPLALQQQFCERVRQVRLVDDDLVQARALMDELVISARTLLFAGS